MKLTRRSFVKGAVMTSTGAAWALTSPGAGRAHAAPAATGSASDMPRGKIGNLEISRLLLGGNLLTHYTHSRDLRYVYNLAAHYNTDEKIMETLALAEAHGVNTLSMHDPPHPMSVLKRYRRERGGKIQWILCTTAPVEPDMVKYRHAVEGLVKDGADAIYLWGVHGDALTNASRIDLIAKAVDVAKSLGVPSGVGAHALDVIQECEKNGVQADFYVKTFHHHNYPTGPKPEELKAAYSEFPGYWCKGPTETAEFMKTVQKPWIAYKVMAAGAIPPADAFKYVLNNGADFVLAGMFDFEIAEDVRVFRDTLAAIPERPRPWRA
ncbi:MAG TPA: hypothetical protein PKM43_15085 [Verrucomicrobiota bacterium]|nr:hypothetical protein [Verrucomicrobiota bacterium]HRZ36801.1 hypothetical protein [Candidatus Paceibacterota bacterium]HRZ55949.1 hypothetical protein [Candidatus Paceibacterota bacterium]